MDTIKSFVALKRLKPGGRSPGAFSSLAAISCLFLILLIAAAGCKSMDQPGSASFASVLISNHSLEEIQNTAMQVFHENGYAGRVIGPGQNLFEKEGTRANDIAYNGIVNTHYGARTVVRVRTELVDLGGGSYRLQCQAFMVRNAGDSFFEEQTRLTKLRSGRYQDLLNEVAKRFNRSNKN